MATDEAKYFQMVTWHVSTPRERNRSLPLLKVDAEKTLESVKKGGHMAGFIRPYPRNDPAVQATLGPALVRARCPTAD